MFTSISNLERYRELRKNRDTVLLDRDGILNVKMPKADYVKTWDDLDLIEEVWDTLDSTSLENDIDYLVITNQPGVARGLVRDQFLDELHTFMSVNALKRGFNLLAYYVCIHGWNDSCTCRKPLAGLIEKAKLDFELNPDRIFFVGDDERDMVAANLGNVEGKLVHATRDFHIIWKEVMSGLGKVS
jgi:D-glycero-D-manno-heptose 1,7-bisphosphate phosphatase